MNTNAHLKHLIFIHAKGDLSRSLNWSVKQKYQKYKTFCSNRLKDKQITLTRTCVCAHTMFCFDTHAAMQSSQLLCLRRTHSPPLSRSSSHLPGWHVKTVIFRHTSPAVCWLSPRCCGDRERVSGEQGAQPSPALLPRCDY